MAEHPQVLSNEAHSRSFAKAVSWRITGSIDTFLISWLITGNASIAGTISAIEVLTKIFLFYAHERAWMKIKWGKKHQNGAN